jgi:hypothetical protein
MWVDVNKSAWVEHDYSEAKDITKDRMKSYFSRRCQEMETLNRNDSNVLNHLRFCTGLDHHTGVINLTIKSLRQPAINNEKAPYLLPNETIRYHQASKEFWPFASFTPEEYGHIDLFDGKGCRFLSYIGGVPYIHPILSDKWNEFYSIPVDRVFGISLNKYPEKIKRGLAIELQSQSMYYVHEVSTEMANFRSEIPPIRWKRSEDKWNAEFLCNQLSRGGLFNGEKTRGYVIAVTFVRDNTDGLKYETVDDTKRIGYDELDLVFMKFLMSEQSGFTENL